MRNGTNTRTNMDEIRELYKLCSGTDKKVYATDIKTGEEVYINLHHDETICVHYKTFGLFASENQINTKYANFKIK